MSSLQIFDLSPVGSSLFRDSESFLDELTDQDSGGIEGGIRSFHRALLHRLTIRSPQLNRCHFRAGRVHGIGISYTAKTVIGD